MQSHYIPVLSYAILSINIMIINYPIISHSWFIVSYRSQRLRQRPRPLTALHATQVALAEGRGGLPTGQGVAGLAVEDGATSDI